MNTHHPVGSRRYFGITLVAGVAIALGLQTLIFLMVLQNTIGPVVFLGKARQADPSMSTEFKVVLFRAANDDPASTGTRASQAWENALVEARIPYRRVSDADLSEGLRNAGSVLILPAAAQLSDPQRDAISAAVAAGMGLVASGAIGTRDASGAWRGWDFLSQMTGVRSPAVVSPPAAISAAFRGQRYFSTSLPAGYNLELPQQQLVTGVTDSPDAFWSDWKLRPAQGDSIAGAALAVHAQRGRGRVVWFGFSETLPGGQAMQHRALNQYLTASVRWTGRQPLAVVGDWPKRKRAAVLVAEDVQDAQAAMPGVELLRQEKIPAIFFCTSAAARTSPAVLRTIQTAGELASGGDSAEAFGDQQTALQTDRLLRSRRELETLSGVKVTGFNPPQGSSNRDTVPSLVNAGYRYYFDGSGARRAVPEIMELGDQGLLHAPRPEVARIYRTASDDFEVIAAYRGPTPWGDDLADGFLNEFRRIEYLGGAYPLLFQSELLGAPQNLHILKTVIQKIKQEPVWIASGEELVDWRSGRDKLSTEVRKIGPHRLRLAINNRGQSDVKDASVYVYLPYRPQKLKVSPVMLQIKMPHTELTGDDDVLRLDLGTVRRQSSQVLLIVLDE